MPFQANLNPPAAIAPGCLVQGRSGLTGPLSCRNTASPAGTDAGRSPSIRRHGRVLIPRRACRLACVSRSVIPLSVLWARCARLALCSLIFPGVRAFASAQKSTRTTAHNGAAIRVLRIRGFDSPSVGMIQIRSAGRSRCFLSAPAGAPCCRIQYSAFCVGCQITAPAQWHQ